MTRIRARRRAHPYFRRAGLLLRGPVAVVIAVIVSLALGYWGYASLPGRDYSVSDNLYRALQLFNGGAELPRSGTPWQLEIARWLAPATLAYAALAAFFALARQEVQRTRTRLFARDHVVIVGLGTRGSRLASSLREEYHVVGIDIDSANGAANTLRHEGVPVLLGDARDEALLRAARADRASHVVVLCGTDTKNLQVAAALKRLTAGLGGTHHVTIDSPVLWNELNRIPLGNESEVEVEFVSIPDRIAVAVLGAAMDAWQGGGDDGTQVLVRGEGAAPARLIVHLLRTEALGDHPEITIVSDDSPGIRTLIQRADPWALERANLVDCSDDVEAAAERSDIAFVCGVPEASALSEAIELVRNMRDGARLYLAVEDPDVAEGLTGAGIDINRLVPVPAADWVLTERLLRERATELLARAKQSAGVLDDIAAGEEHSERAWEQLTRPERESKRRLADEILREIGQQADGDLELVPLNGPPEAADEFPFADDQADHFAEDAHDRWVQSEATFGRTEPRWKELPEERREEIRAEVKELPQTLARAGYRLRRSGERS